MKEKKTLELTICTFRYKMENSKQKKTWTIQNILSLLQN